MVPPLPPRPPTPPSVAKSTTLTHFFSSSSLPSTAQHSPILRLGSLAPDFWAQTTLGPIQFHTWLGNSWCVLFSHPADFTPVCTTELGAVSRRIKEFRERGVKVIGLSVDDLEDHAEWIKDINALHQVDLRFPLIADKDRRISRLYDMLDDPTHDPSNVNPSGAPMTVRSIFIIDPVKRIRLIFTYPASCGRNFDELIRVIDSLFLTDQRRVTTPVDWSPGDEVIIHPSVSNEEAKNLFPNYRMVKPYYRTTQLP
ncbi:MAG: cysteine peroxiredoxin, partial [Piptocephalis tieghemiana]